MKRTMIVVTLLMAAMVVLSGPVAGVLDLPEPTAQAKKKKKKKKNRPRLPTYNVVQCPNQEDGQKCLGTGLNDYLVGTDGFDRIFGGEGNDVYNGKKGDDFWTDESTTSNDYYLVGPSLETEAYAGIRDQGGSADVADVRPFRSTDVTGYVHGHVSLKINANGDVAIFGVYEDAEEYFVFADRTLTREQLKALANSSSNSVSSEESSHE